MFDFDIEEVIEYSQNLKLLYVEDNEEARLSTIVVLEEFFHNIVVAIDGEDGYDKFKENSDIDIIITDINMPKMNGLEMIEKIRSVDSTVPILVLSAYNESGFFMDSIKLGVEGYLLKPIDIDQFLGVLNKTIEKLKLAKEITKSNNLLNQYKNITDKSSIISVIDTNGVITYVNDLFCEISQYTKEELIGSDYHSLLKYQQPKEIHDEIWDTILNKKEIWQGVVKFISRYGDLYYLKTTIKPILDENGEIIEYIALRDDITEVMNPKKQLNDAIKNSDEPLVVYIKLEDYSTLEEFYDNSTVEHIQDKVTEYLEENIPQTCKFEKVYQLGNGEYAMTNEKKYCMGGDQDNFLTYMKEYQERIKDCKINIGEIDYDLSIMISISYDDEQVLESAKLGIKKLIHNKQNFIVSNNFAKIEKEKAQKNMETISMVKKALSECKIVSYFQPIINNKTKEIEKYESLVRLIDENDKVLSPFFFLDVAKKGKYYSQITNMVLDNSFSALKSTSADISINLSALDIELKPTRDKIFKLLEEHKEYANRIVLELLEDEGVKNFNIIKEFITDVKNLGVNIAIDDFGAGYSNFERLLDYQPDILKIDGCLVRDIETNSYSYSVVKTIVIFAKEQNIKTVAEFVENEKIYNILNDLGVDYSQGYYFGKPTPTIDKR